MYKKKDREYMKSIRDRFFELLKIPTDSWNISNEYTKAIEGIKKEYFYDKLDIKLVIRSIKSPNFYYNYFDYYINDDVIVDDLNEFLEKLDRLYQLINIKRKIKNL